MNCLVYCKGKSFKNSDKTWTTDQTLAFEKDAKEIYVSAAAGSGKTSVLTQRIIEKISSSLDIDDFLVTTFTKAAANSLKKKIEKSIQTKLLTDSGNIHLANQLGKISSSDICTMDSFFFDLVMDNTNYLGLPSNFGVLEKFDEHDIDYKVLDEMIDDYANGNSLFPGTNADETLEKFKNLISTYGELNNPKSIKDVIIRLYSAYSSFVDVKGEMLCSLTKDSGFKNSPWYNYLYSSLDDIITHLTNVYNYILPSKQTYIDTKGFTESGFNQNLDGISGLIKLYKGIKTAFDTDDYLSARELLAVKYSFAQRKLPEQRMIFLSLKTFCNNGDIFNLYKSVLDNDISNLDKFVHSMYQSINDLGDFILDFQNRTFEEKKKRKMFSFNDITRLTYQLLSNENGESNSICDGISKRYKEIYIDEFQDTNQIQFKIFSLLSKYANLFVVGDVKQSIYGFRDSEPEILNDKINDEKIIKIQGDQNKNNYDRIKIFLSQNFRSSCNVINFINKIFDVLACMCDVFPYSKEDRLVKGRGDIFKYSGYDKYHNFEKDIENNIQLNDTDEIIVFSDEDIKDKLKFENIKAEYILSSDLIYDVSKLKKQRLDEYDVNGRYVDTIFSYGEEAFLQSTYEIFNPRTECIIVRPKTSKKDGDDTCEDFDVSYPIVGKIIELHEKYNYDYSDIAILVRTNNDASELACTLQEYNIPTSNENYYQFFSNPEVVYIINLLEAINNSSKDMYVAGSIVSPLYSFTLSDLIYIRQKYVDNKGCTLYEMLNMFVESDDKNEELKDKVKKYLSDLVYFKSYLANNNCYLLIDKIYLKTNLITLFMLNDDENYASIKDNLNTFREFVYRYERGKQITLYDLLLYIEFVKEDDKYDVNTEKRIGEKSGVIITTYHKSKGLEYPVVIVPYLEKPIKKGDSTNYILSKHFPLTLSLVIPDENINKPVVRYESCLNSIAKMYNLDRAEDEELRLFYVGLTRAREKLILFANPTKADYENVIDESRIEFLLYSKANKTSISSFLSYIIATKFIYPNMFNFEYVDRENFDYSKLKHKRLESVQIENKPVYSQSDIEALKDEFLSRFAWEYANDDETFIKSKLYVSMVYPGILDYDVEKPEEVIVKEKYFNDEQPRFIKNIPEQRKAGDVGTLMHSFMAYLNLNNVDNYGLDYELDRMISDEYMDKNDVDLLMKDKLMNFCKSNLAYKIRRAKEIFRETRFVKSFPAQYFTNNPSRKERLENKPILVQGQIDLLIKDENDEWILVDYKTDFSGRSYLVEKNFAIKTLIERHALQLALYKEACEELFKIKINHTLLYSFAIDDTIELTGEQLDYKKLLEMNL